MTYDNSSMSPQPHPIGTSFQDLTGNVYNRLIVTCYVGKHGKHALWQCQCACGSTHVTRADSLKDGKAKSCGCLQSDSLRARFTTHGLSHTPVHQAWKSMMHRCFVAKDVNFPGYGGRGITVCPYLQTFDGFMLVVGARPSDELSVDRENNEGNYSCGQCPTCIENKWPMNVRWATLEEQNNNRRSSRFITHNGTTQSLTLWSREYHIHVETLRHRLLRGWSMHDALTVSTAATGHRRKAEPIY